MAYIPSVGQAVLFGGRGSGAFLGDTWMWKAGCWTSVTTAGPSARMGMAMAYDPTRKAVVAFGGRTDPSKQIFSSETWAWDGASWSLLNSSGPALQWVWAAYDPAAGRVLLYASTNGVSSTWTWDGGKWNVAPGQSPPARQAATMASDPVTGEPMIFGGLSLDPQPTAAAPDLNDTWAWSGVSWARLAPAHSPPARSAATMTTSSKYRRVLLVGGRLGPTFYTDAWTWDGADWIQTTGVGGRIDAVAVDVGTKILVFGGVNITKNSLTNDSEVWDGSSWSSS